MKNIIANPHNGTHVEAEGICLPPGHEIEVEQQVAVALKQRHDFLQHRTIEGKPAFLKAKARKLKKVLHFSVTTHPDPDVADFAVHAEKGAAPRSKSEQRRVAAVKAAAKKGKKK